MDVDKGDRGASSGDAPRSRGLVALERFEAQTTSLAQRFRDVMPLSTAVVSAVFRSPARSARVVLLWVRAAMSVTF